VIGEQREEQLLADGLVPRPAPDALEPLERGAVERGREQVVGDQSRLEHVLEFEVGAGELVQCLGVDGIRFLAAEEEEELATEEERVLGSLDRVDDQRVGLLQMLDGGVAADERPGGAELQ
jgi:hypothetical protein